MKKVMRETEMYTTEICMGKVMMPSLSYAWLTPKWGASLCLNVMFFLF